jgi:hypothetical protein
LHNKPQECGASVASAAGPFTTKKNKKEEKAAFVFFVCLFYQSLIIYEYDRWSGKVKGKAGNIPRKTFPSALLSVRNHVDKTGIVHRH